MKDQGKFLCWMSHILHYCPSSCSLWRMNSGWSDSCLQGFHRPRKWEPDFALSTPAHVCILGTTRTQSSAVQWWSLRTGKASTFRQDGPYAVHPGAVIRKRNSQWVVFNLVNKTCLLGGNFKRLYVKGGLPEWLMTHFSVKKVCLFLTWAAPWEMVGKGSQKVAVFWT